MVRVLICDDQTVVREGLAAILSTDPDIQVVGLAGNGQEALDAVMRGGYDLVMMDCDLPVMDGYEATRHIRQWEAGQGNPTRIPVVAMTGSVREEIERRCRNVGMNAYLAKPYRKEQLYSILHRLLPRSAVESP